MCVNSSIDNLNEIWGHTFPYALQLFPFVSLPSSSVELWGLQEPEHSTDKRGREPGKEKAFTIASRTPFPSISFYYSSVREASVGAFQTLLGSHERILEPNSWSLKGDCGSYLEEEMCFARIS